MNVVILTSSMEGSASVHLKELAKSDVVRIRAVVFSQGGIENKRSHLGRKFKKILKIGLFGAINGVRIRKYFTTDLNQYIAIESIESICSENKIPFIATPTINCDETIASFRKANAEVGLSLGNGYIGSKVFSLPEFGMINIHHEQLPDYQNAQSIIWQIYNGSMNTGYTIHKIDKNIDQGEILFQELVPIDFRDSFGETISYNYAKLWEKSAVGLVKVLEDFQNYFHNSKPQGKGTSYTTPGFASYIKMLSEFRRLKSKRNTDVVV